MGLGDVVNKFHDKDSFADSGTAEETNFTSLGIGSQQVYDFDASDQDFLLDRHLFEFRSLCVNGGSLVSVDGTTFINGITNDVDNATKGFITDGEVIVCPDCAKAKVLGGGTGASASASAGVLKF